MSKKVEIWDNHHLICHYTKFENVKKIFDSKTIWAQHYTKLEDPRDIIHARDMMINYLTKKYSRLPVRAITDTYAKYLTDVYVTSFTKTELKVGLCENDGILSMWRYYGHYKAADQGGCCIVFKSKKPHERFVNHILTKLPAASAIVFNEVQYDGIKECQKNIKHKMREYCRCLKILIHLVRNGIPHEKEQGEYIKSFIRCVSLFKYQAFFEEREIRMVIFTNPRIGVIDNEITIEPGKPLYDHLEIPFEFDDVKKIIIGPQRNQDLKKNEIESYLNGLGLTIPVYKSKIPLRMLLK